MGAQRTLAGADAAYKEAPAVDPLFAPPDARRWPGPEPDLFFTVFGHAVPKGSKSAFAVRKRGVYTGRVAVVDDTTKGLKVWTGQIDEAVQTLAGEGTPMLDGPLVAGVRFYLERPKSHPKTRRTWPDGRPDLGKALRALEDRMIGILIRDDSRIVRFAELLKDFSYYTPDPRPRAEVALWTMATWEAWRP